MGQSDNWPLIHVHSAAVEAVQPMGWSVPLHRHISSSALKASTRWPSGLEISCQNGFDIKSSATLPRRLRLPSAAVAAALLLGVLAGLVRPSTYSGLPFTMTISLALVAPAIDFLTWARPWVVWKTPTTANQRDALTLLHSCQRMSEVKRMPCLL